LITFACYGARLHGDESGSVDPDRNLPGTRLVETDAQRAVAERQEMDQEPFILDQPSRSVVLESIRETCVHRGWTLLAAHVRTNHVHVVVDADVRPERLLNALKSYASRSLNRLGSEPDRKRWARHGSTRWLWKDEDVRQAIQYVVEEQGEPMAVFVAELI
jgi:REP element-mobilizing transposase RayT